ncbi:hypothetical protein F5Y15DRAFT_97998 [Xylariaceae sp. FL0016]|nr:hypothetical protein F5Y15DRAFT_97998 [Xylariaceae sp. FL0016]
MADHQNGPLQARMAGIAFVPSRAEHKRLTRRSRVHAATLFEPRDPDETPEQHFPLQTVHPRTYHPRFVNRYNSREILLVVDGSCVNNGSRDPVLNPLAGGCSFSYKGRHSSGPPTSFPFSNTELSEGGTVGFPLELSGPAGEDYDPTSNRAKLRAVIAALEFRAWQGEGWHRIVVATDLEYVAYGATKWLPGWVRNRWRSKTRTKGRGRRKIANRDLWEELHATIEELSKAGTQVSFWLIAPKSAIKQGSDIVRATKDAAREAATIHYDPVSSEFTRLCGIMV